MSMPPSGGMRQDPGRGVLILVMGILSLVLCPIICGPIAWIMGSGDMKKINAGLISQEAKSTTQIGMILGIIGTVLILVQLVVCFLFWGTVAAWFGLAAKDVKDGGDIHKELNKGLQEMRKNLENMK